jgi:bacteriocin-like protein
VPTFAPLYSPSELQPQKAQAFKSNGVAQEVNMKEMAYEELAQVTGGYPVDESLSYEERMAAKNGGAPIYTQPAGGCGYLSQPSGDYITFEGQLTVYPNGYAVGGPGRVTVNNPNLPANCNPLP